MPTGLDVTAIRARFPGLRRESSGRPVVMFDGPAGSQVPESVAAAMTDWLLHHNANRGGAFATSRETDAMVEAASAAMADFLGAGDPDEIVFGPNMTSLTFALSRALASTWRRGDRVLVTDADHDANVMPWVLAGAAAGVDVQRIGVLADGRIDTADLERRLTDRTRLVAFGTASNLLGTIQPVAEITRLARARGVLTYVDAVHSAPHRLPAVAAWGCDFAVCSAYKFFGPHTGVLWGRRELLQSLPAAKVRPAGDDIPDRWMTGTPNLEGIAGSAGAVEYLAGLGGAGDGGRRGALQRGFALIEAHEQQLCERLLRGVAKLPGVRVAGVAEADAAQRVPTVALAAKGRTPQELHATLAGQGIFTWAGHSYALALSAALGLEPHGALRIGLLHYNTATEVDRLLQALASVLA